MVAAIANAEDPGDVYNVTWGVQQHPTLTEQEMVNLNFSWFAEAWAPVLDSQSALYAVTGYFGNTPPAEDDIWISENAPAPGTRGGASLPPNCAVLMQKRTGVGGRRNRGRCYLPHCVGETDVNEGGVIAAAVLATLQNRADVWLDRLNNGGVPGTPTPAFLLHGVDPVTGDPFIPTPVTSHPVSGTIATQRRRLRR
jgi:hypothetical protein